ncbi:MAG: ABC transporter permease [Candidatus Aminicenantes bacterium]|nr:ABC transporter permease [Candidatus Aminicenantes bacterium]
MFDLEKAIKKWKKDLDKSRILEDGDIVELESHLRDGISHRMERGLEAERAFMEASKELGWERDLDDEFFKSHFDRPKGRPPWRSPRFMPALLWNYSKVTLRKIKRQKGYSLINIAGLAVGMACYILMFLWVQDELGFDGFHKNKNTIFRVISETQTAERTITNARSPVPLGPALKDNFPEVVKFARYQGFDGWPVRANDKFFINDNLGTADPEFFNMFTFPFLRGDPENALSERYSIVVTERMARKYYGENDPMGKVISIGQDDFTITGVLQDIPENSHLQFDCIFPVENMETYWEMSFKDWRRNNFYNYLQIQPGTDVKELAKKIGAVVEENLPRSQTEFFLQPLKDIHLRSDFEWDLDNYKQGHMSYIYIFLLTALGILIIACINFMNLATARSATWAKEVGMRKVSGARRPDIIKQFLGESLTMSVVALAFALVLVQVLIPSVNRIAEKELSLNIFSNGGLVLGLLGIVLFTGLAAGSYPALFLSSFRPAAVLRSVFGLRMDSGRLRRVLVVFQFTLTITTIICTLFIYRQMRYIKNKDLGFNKDFIVLVDDFHSDYDVLRTGMMQIPGVVSVSASIPPDRRPWGDPGFSWEGKSPDNRVLLYALGVDPDYLKTFGIKMAQGRFFSREVASDATDAVVINQTAARTMGLENPIGKRLKHRQREGTIIGIVEDFHQSSLHNTIEPMVLFSRSESPNICVRISPKDVPATLAALKETYEKHVTWYPFKYRFLDESLDANYKAEQRIETIFKFATLTIIFVAVLGLFGLASFTAEQRTKEIGIRKVLGASVTGIVVRFSKQFAGWVLLANVLAWPGAYIAARFWLRHFAYRIDIGPAVFLLSALLAVVIALGTVGFQAVRAAKADPVESLRYE